MTQDSNISSPSSQIQAARRRGLGRGLDALFENAPKGGQGPTPPSVRPDVQAPDQNAALQQNEPAPDVQAAAPVQTTSSGRTMLPLTALQPGAFQPRRTFDTLSIESLAQSIVQHGILQPLLVRPLAGTPGMYEIIAGERRWRAAQRARLHDVPVVIERNLSDRDALQIGLIENLQREDLNPIDEAAGYQRLVDEFHLTPERLGDMIGKSRGHIANMMRLLTLPEGVRGMLAGGSLSAGHARALIGLPNAEELAQEIAARGSSVRQVEKMAAQLRETSGREGARARSRRSKKQGLFKDKDVQVLEQSLCTATGLNVTIDMKTETGGRLSIDFKNLDQLDFVIKRLSRRKGDPA